MTRITTSALLALVLPGCAVPTFHRITAAWDEDSETATDSDASATDSSGSTWPGPISTVTSATTSAGSESEVGTDATDTAGDTDATTTDVGEPEGPPAIVNHELDPATIHDAGALTPKIWADHADGVRMNLEDGTEVELTLNLETHAFEGEIAAVSGFQNSDDLVATFVPWRMDGDLVVQGDPLALPYAIALPTPGGEALWSVDYEHGSGVTAAIGVLPNGRAIELLTLVNDGSSGCFLRQRSADGEVLGELAPLLADHCKATDLQIRDGAMYALMTAETQQGSQWWVAKIPYWGAYHSVVATGDKGEVAYALAISTEEGTIAVCGSAPTAEPDDLEDALVRVVRPNFSQYTRKFDHVVENQGHRHDEQAHGCAFDPLDENRLILVGSVYGQQKDEVEKRNRRFDAFYDLEADVGDLRVADIELGATQSVATDVAFAEGHAFVVGYTCGNDVCDQVEARIWTLDGDGDLTSTRSLGLHSDKALAPSRIRPSPAKYLVVTSGADLGNEGAFVIRAYDPFKAEPLWTYSRKDGGLVHLSHALAIGPYGQVYAGGFGAKGYPLFVILFG